MLGNGLRKRIAALEADIQQARRDHTLEPRWRRELVAARAQAVHVNHTIPLPRAGVDYSFARYTGEQLRERGATFAGRYLTGEGKALGHTEALSLSRAGIDLVALYELGSEAMAGGTPAGEHDGRQALAAAHAIGMPQRRPIYFACDFDATGEQLHAALDYMRAAKGALNGRYDAGGYGGLAFVRTIQGAGFTYAWQTLAWSGGVWDDRAQLRQTAIGAELDTDYAYAADFGQWKV